MDDDLRRYRSRIRKMRERVFRRHPEKLALFDEQYDTERLRAQEEFPGAPDVGQYWAERRTWDWAWGTDHPFPGGMVPPMMPRNTTPANAGPAGVVNQVPKGSDDSNGAPSSASKADHNSSAAEANAPIAQSASSKKQPSANASKAADKQSQGFRGMSLGGPKGSSHNPPTQQRRIAIPRPRLPTIEAAAAQDRLRAELAGLQRTLEQLQPPVNPNQRKEREVAAMEKVVLRNTAWVALFLVELQRGQAGALRPPRPSPAPPAPTAPSQAPAPRHPHYVEVLVPPKEPPSPGQAGKGDDEDMSNS